MRKDWKYQSHLFLHSYAEFFSWKDNFPFIPSNYVGISKIYLVLFYDAFVVTKMQINLLFNTARYTKLSEIAVKKAFLKVKI